MQCPSVLGHCPLSDIKINDLPDNIKKSVVRLFADDCQTIQTPGDCNELQDDLHNLEQWEMTWLMKFNPNKCCVITISLA